MKLLSIFLLFIFISITESNDSVKLYDPLFVKFSQTEHKNIRFKMIDMNREGSEKRIKIKYFSSRDVNTGESVSTRFSKWRKGRNIICYSSGAYMVSNGSYYTPEGFNVDNGVLVNSALESNRFDGLVIVYATGGMVGTNLKDGDLILGDFPNRKFDLRKSSLDKSTFQNWCEQNGATVFQTHLLIYKNQLQININSDTRLAKRRCLAVGKINGEIHHTFVYLEDKDYTLYEASSLIGDFLKSHSKMDIIYMINLDSGMDNCYGAYDSDGRAKFDFQGTANLEDTASLLVYYYE